jgi:hypothetical protein
VHFRFLLNSRREHLGGGLLRDNNRGGKHQQHNRSFHHQHFQSPWILKKPNRRLGGQEKLF